MASKKANPLHPEQIIDCFICAFPIDGEKRLYSYGVCGHKDVCSICYLRIRALQKKELSCPSCKTPLEKVICSKESNINFTDFTFWGDSIGPDFHFDERSQMFFPPNYYKEHVQMLWLSKCKLCSQVKRDSKGLRSHLHAQHNLEMCTLCIEHRNAFPSEHTYFSQKEYEAHLRHGDKEGAQGHPFCEFCRKRYYDKTAFFMHLQQEHFKCHICDREGILHKYYDTYDTLESHFRSHHHLCEDPLCIAKKYEVFSNAIDLAAHERQYHPGHQVCIY